MAYSDFTLRKVSQDFKLTLTQGTFLSQYEPISPSAYLAQFLEKSLPLAIALGTEKARSEMIICPILIEVREILQREISLFSGVDFTVDSSLGDLTEYPVPPTDRILGILVSIVSDKLPRKNL